MQAIESKLPRALFFGPSGQELFGWLHCPPTGESVRDIGVVLCAAYGREELCSHRTLLHLANSAARAGMPALRFDYLGTGDSAGSDQEPGRVVAWVNSVTRAIEELKRQTGVSRICLVGLRLGAALGLLAAQGRDDVIAMACIAPVVSGRAFMREIKLLALSARRGKTASAEPGGAIEAGGFIFSEQTQSDIAAINVLQLVVPRSFKALIIDREEAPGAQQWVDSLRQTGVWVDHRLEPGYPEMMEGTVFNVIPHKMIADVALWLGDLAHSCPAAPPPAPPNEAPQASRLSTAAMFETPVAIGDAPQLAGLLSEPARDPETPTQGPKVGVILLSAGIARRIGPSRLYVELAREWAGQGVTVLRLDLSGLGDSPSHPKHGEQMVYSPAAMGEVTRAVELMRSRIGDGALYVMGMCSGGYHGLKAALNGADVDSVVVINPLTFNWREGDTLISDHAPHVVTQAVSQYWKSLRKPADWLRLLRGDLHLARMVKRLWLRWQMIAHSSAMDVARILGIQIKGDLGVELQTAARRGVTFHLVFSRGEIGPSLLATAAGISVRRLQRKKALTLTRISNADHIFTTQAARDKLRSVLDRFLKTQIG